jgi:hypothetical protein
VGARREYDGWVERDALDPEAAAGVAYLDRLAEVRSDLADVLVAHVDGYGVVTSTITLDRGVELFLQARDGWDRVLWTCPSGRVHEWSWRERETPKDLDALLDGRGVERTLWVGSRLVGALLVVEDRTLATAAGKLRLGVLRGLGTGLRQQDEPAL